MTSIPNAITLGGGAAARSQHMSFGETQICPQSAVAATETIWPANPHIVAIWSFTGKLCWPLLYVFNSPMSVPPCFAILQVRRLEHQEWLVLVDCHTARKWVQDLHCPDRLQKVHSHTLYNTVFLIFWASPRSRHSEPPEWISSWSPIASKKNFSSTPASISLFPYQISMSLTVSSILGSQSRACLCPSPKKWEDCREQAGALALTPWPSVQCLTCNELRKCGLIEKMLLGKQGWSLYPLLRSTHLQQGLKPSPSYVKMMPRPSGSLLEIPCIGWKWK